MPGLLTNPIDEIVGQLIIDLGLGTLPSTPPSVWPVYTSQEPPNPDNCITVFITSHKDHGKFMKGGQRQNHYGAQVRVRATDHITGWQKINNIAISLDESVANETVGIDANRYVIPAVTIASGPLNIGQETPESKRVIFTLNVLASIRQTA